MKRLLILALLIILFPVSLLAQTKLPAGKQGTMTVRKNKVQKENATNVRQFEIQENNQLQDDNMIQMPELRQQSLKKAQMELKMRGLVLDKITKSPSEYDNIVLKQLANGQEIKAGEFISRKTKISLVIGLSKKED